MTQIEMMLQKNEKKLLDLYLRANTKSKRKILARDLITFSYISREHFGLDKVFVWEKDEKILSLLNERKISFLQNITGNASVYSNIFTSVLSSFIENDYQIYSYYNKPYQRLTHKEIQQLMFDFLRSYDSDLVDVLKKKMNNDELFCGDLSTGMGFTYSLGSINKNLIFYDPVFGDDIDIVANIIHEFGHSYEMSTFYSVGIKNYFDFVISGPYYEVVSKFFEYAFLNFLIENNICIMDANMRLNEYLFNLLKRSYDIHLLYQMKKISIDELNKIYIVDEDIAMYAKEIQEKINYYDFASNIGDTIDYKKDFLYGIGGLFSIYLYENYKENPDNFKKEFRNALLTYPYINNINAFEKVGITEDILVDGKVLKKVLRNIR